MKKIDIVELTVGYETNLEKNAKRKKAKYSELVIDQSDHFEKVNFVNISMSSLGVYGKECSAFISACLMILALMKTTENTASSE